MTDQEKVDEFLRDICYDREDYLHKNLKKRFKAASNAYQRLKEINNMSADESSERNLNQTLMEEHRKWEAEQEPTLTEEELTDSPLADTVNLGDIEWEYLEQWVNRETVPLPIVHAICFGVAEQLIKNRKANDE